MATTYLVPQAWKTWATSVENLVGRNARVTVFFIYSVLLLLLLSYGIYHILCIVDLKYILCILHITCFSCIYVLVVCIVYYISSDIVFIKYCMLYLKHYIYYMISSISYHIYIYIADYIYITNWISYISYHLICFIPYIIYNA